MSRFAARRTQERGRTLGPAECEALDLPHHVDWAWRPGPLHAPEATPHALHSGTRLSPEVALFHDAPGEAVAPQIALRPPHANETTSEVQGTKGGTGLALEIGRFQGSYLSLSVDLPPEAMQGLDRSHILRLDVELQVAAPLEIYARLNIAHGPNTAQILRALPGPAPGRPAAVGFDLAYTSINPNRLGKLWLDLIFAGPAENRLVLRDLTLCRHPRARC